MAGLVRNTIDRVTPRSIIALASDMCVDLILRGDVRPRFGQAEQLLSDYQIEIGGSANIFACQTAKLGLATALWGRVGADAFGTLLTERLGAAGVDISRVLVDRQLKTGLGVALSDGEDRGILTYQGSINALGPDDLPEHPAQVCQHWHVSSYYLLGRLRPAWPAFFARARQEGVSLSLDPNWDPAERWDGVMDLLPFLNLIFVNEAELMAISGADQLVAAATELARKGPTVVVKRGVRGAMAVRGSDVTELAAGLLRPVPDLVDSIGAGDNFAAGFLAAWLDRRSLNACLAHGHACAEASLRAPGGIAGQITTSQALKDRVPDDQIA